MTISTAKCNRKVQRNSPPFQMLMCFRHICAQEEVKAMWTDRYTFRVSIQLAKKDICCEEVLEGAAGWTVKELPLEFH